MTEYIIISLAIIVIISLSYFFNKNYTFEEINIPSIKLESICDNPKITVYTIGTSINKELYNMLLSLKQNMYNYKLVGLGLKWNGYKDKIGVYLDACKKHKQKYGTDGIIIIVDGYDAFSCKESKGLFEKFNELTKKIIVKYY